MTVSSTLRTATYTGTGLVSSYPLPFKFFDPTTVIVEIDGVVQVQGGDYSITGDGEALAGTIVLAVALVDGAVLYAERVVPYLQEVDITGQGNFLPETYEDAIDVLEFQIQQLAAGINGVIQIIQEMEVFQAMQTLTTITETEVLLVTSGPTALPTTPMTGRLTVEIQNNGPNPIVVGSVSGTLIRTLQIKESWTLDYTGPMWGKATVADQVTGAATVVTEGK